MRIGVLDHLSLNLGGSQLVVASMAAELAAQHQVDLIHDGRGYTMAALGAAFAVDLSRVQERIVADVPHTFARTLREEIQQAHRFDRELTESYDLFIYSGHGIPPYSWAGHGLVYCHFPYEAEPILAHAESWQRRSRAEQWLLARLYRYRWQRRMRGYRWVLANSKFTSAWVERLWGRAAQVLYPPVAVAVPPVAKENVIVSIGRFGQSDRKNTAAQIETFARLRQSLGSDWQLCLIGFCADFPEDQAHLEKLRTQARGLPVEFLINAPRSQVLSKLAAAKILWHTTALDDLAGVDPRYQEHFGIATVEAMLTGCVPLVPAGGGQPEIVEHDVSGYLCRDFDELAHYTRAVAHDEERRRAMSAAALRGGQSFRPESFVRTLRELVNACL